MLYAYIVVWSTRLIYPSINFRYRPTIIIQSLKLTDIINVNIINVLTVTVTHSRKVVSLDIRTTQTDMATMNSYIICSDVKVVNVMSCISQACSYEHQVEASSHAAIIARLIFVHKYPTLSVVSYSIIQLSELEQCRVKQIAQGLTCQHRIRTRILFVESPIEALATAPRCVCYSQNKQNKHLQY